MPRPAKTLLAGIAIAIPLISAAATSFAADSQVANDQTQAGNVEATQTLNVDTSTDQTTGVATAAGNSASAAVVYGSVDVQSSQSMQGNADASGVLNVTTYAGQVGMTAASTGNTGEAGIQSGGPMTGSFGQDVSGNVTAESQINAATGQAGDVTVTTEAVGDTQGLSAVGGSIGASVTQTNEGVTQSYSGAVLNYSPGNTTFSAVGIGNNVTSTSVSGASQNVSTTQVTTGDRVQAAQFLAFGNVQSATNAATATANNVSVSNDGPSLNVVTFQDNQSYVRAQAESGAYEFGASSVMATGIGNSAIADETGPQITLDNVQINGTGGVEVIASSTGTQGYDLSSSATAMGNAVTGFACSDCSGQMTINNTQVNGSNITATNSVGVVPGGTARSVTGVTTAVGNSATFYVTKPN
jgi:hypothetical protein